jgi:nucleoside-diphosphate-sugar epimerase
MTALESSSDEIGGRFINMGNEKQNVQIRDIADIIKKKIGEDCRIELYGDADNRSYKVKFDRARELLGFETKYSIENGIDEIIEKCATGLDDIPQMHTVDYYKKLIGYEGELKRFTNLKQKVIL